MKRILLAIALLFTTHCLFAQKVGFTIQGGLNVPSITAAPQGGGAPSQAHATFQIGGVFDIKFKDFTLQPAVLLTGKGNRSTTTENFISNSAPVPYTYVRLTNVTYLEVPLNVVYKHVAKPGTWYLGAGPYIAHALWGSYSFKSQLNTYYKRVNSSDALGSGDDQLKSTDYGANILGGLEMNNGLKLGLNYGLGLSNLTNSGTSSQNRVLSLVIGYSFK